MTRKFRACALVVVGTSLAALAVGTVPAVAAPAAPGGLSAAAVTQISALASAKAARTPAQRKVSSQLLTAITQQAGGRVAAGVGPLATAGVTTTNGAAHVSVTATAGSDPYVVSKRVLDLGGRVRHVWPTTVDADVPLRALATLAALPAVRRVDPAGRATVASAPGPVHDRIQGRVSTAVATPAAPGTGATVTEGDVTLGAAVARASYRVGGAGITVGVLSDGVSSLKQSIDAGELPADTTVLPGQEGQGDEGTAMLQIVHDVAPNADLLFATAFESADGFAANIKALRAAGADVIVDDVIYYAESPFQDGPIAQAVSSVIADGATYFSSAGNQGNVTDGSSGNWEGDFVSSGQSLPKNVGALHDFAPGAVVQASNPLSDEAAGTVTTLFWADPLGKAVDDYDLYVLDASGRVVAMANDTQDGDDDPFEGIDIPFATGLRLAVVKFAGADRYLQVTTFGGRFASAGGLTGYVTPGTIRGHSAVPAAYSVAAAPAAGPLPIPIVPGVANPTGPFPKQFKQTQQSELFTSDGPRRVFFTPTGKAVTPGNTSATGGTVRRKPDITSADGTSTSIFGFDPFFGTSAAAPHAAATAALVLSGNPGITPAALRTALTASALDIEGPGWDRDTGYGIAMATRVLATTGATPQPRVDAGTPLVQKISGAPNYLRPGATARLAVPLRNTGDGDAANVNVAVTAGGATVTPSLVQVGSIAAGATGQAVVAIAVPATAKPGDLIRITATVRFTGSLSPTTFTTSLPVGKPGPVRTFAYTGAPAPIPDNDPVGVTLPVKVSGLGAVSGITFSFDGNDCTSDTGVGLQHPTIYDLVARLTAPDGTRVTLLSRTGGFDGDNYCQTVLDDAAPDSIQNAPDYEAPFTGTYHPLEPLQPFLGTNGNGTWKLTVSDEAERDTGTVRAFSIHLAGYVL